MAQFLGSTPIEQELQKLEINALINKVASADEYYQSIKLEESLDKESLVEECM
jgi:hypothetical protein